MEDRQRFLDLQQVRFTAGDAEAQGRRGSKLILNTYIEE
jgi:hypothetical protein